MRQLFTGVVVTLLAVACAGNEEAVPTQFSRTFSNVQCWTGPGAVSGAPCSSYTSPSHIDKVDSGRVVFSANNSVQWMFSTHTHWCPCYLGGCSTPCYDDPSLVSTRTGTYDIVGNTVFLTFAQGEPSSLKLQTAIPARVPKSWAGPDSLLCIACTNSGGVIFKSS